VNLPLAVNSTHLNTRAWAFKRGIMLKKTFFYFTAKYVQILSWKRFKQLSFPNILIIAIFVAKKLVFVPLNGSG
jgi:hypothetical protein